VKSTGSPGFTASICVSFKFAVIQTSSSGTTLMSGWPACTSCPSSTVFLLTTPDAGAVMRV